MIPRVLVIGYGNALRGDDGVGWRVAQAIAEQDLPGVDVLCVQQLTPELASDLSEVGLAVLIDADAGLAPGDQRIEEMDGAAVVEDAAETPWSHHVAPAGLMALAQELYGRTPRLAIVRVGVAAMDPGEGLTPAVEAAVPRIVAAVADRIRAEVMHGVAHA